MLPCPKAVQCIGDCFGLAYHVQEDVGLQPSRGLLKECSATRKGFFTPALREKTIMSRFVAAALESWRRRMRLGRYCLSMGHGPHEATLYALRPSCASTCELSYSN